MAYGHNTNFKMNLEDMFMKKINLFVLAFIACVFMMGSSVVSMAASGSKAKDKIPPKISSVKVSNISSDGYKISCKAVDNVAVTKVMVAVWTNANGQDDLRWYQAKLKGDTATLAINSSDHNYESGKYITHIYVYDAAGNVTGNSSMENKVNIPKRPELDFSRAMKKWKDKSYSNGNYKNVASQCHGWALNCGNLLTNTDPLKWKKKYDLNNIKSGDIIRFNRPHTIIIQRVNGNTVTYADCNWYRSNTVKYNNTCSKSQLTKKFGSLGYVLVCPK